MQMVSEVMTRDIRFVAPQESLQRAAQMMDELNVGALPVCEGERLVGMVTDRDITVRATAAGRAPAEAHVEEVMSTDVRWCFEDQAVDDVMRQMADTQIRRVPVVTHDDAHKLVGIVSLGDLATKTAGGAQKRDVERTMEKVSSPSEPDRSSRGAAGLAASGVSSRTGSDTGTASGLAGSELLDTAGEEAHAEAGAGAGSPDANTTDTGATSGLSAAGAAGTATSGAAQAAQDAGGPQPGMAGPGTGDNTLGRAGTAGTSSAVNAPVAGAAGDATPAGAAGTGGRPDAARDDNAAPGGIDAAGPSGASGGVAGSGGAGGAGAATGKGRKRK